LSQLLTDQFIAESAGGNKEKAEEIDKLSNQKPALSRFLVASILYLL